MPATERLRYIILGAGAAGLSLCCALLERGIQEPILIIDQKTTFTDDRTWCFWNVRPTPFTNLATRCWHRWNVFDSLGNTASQASSKVGYVCLRGQDFYRCALARIHRHGNVTLKMNCPVENCRSYPDFTVVQAGGILYQADYVFDSRPRPSPNSDGIALTQRFFGQFIKTEAPCFDPSCCTLMDFQASQELGLHFFYTLPFSPTEALIENTYIQESQTVPVAPEQHCLELGVYLQKTLGHTPYTILREEIGAIPMTTKSFPKRDGRVFFIGTAGGCTKPSSGYTFLRIQEQCRQIADAAQASRLEDFRERPPAARYRLFDIIFLQAMRDRPDRFPHYFHRLFQSVPPEALAAFLSETSTWRSDARIIRSLPILPFLQAALKSLPLWLRHPRPSPSISG
jgi:lycopene beta-cyclase